MSFTSQGGVKPRAAAKSNLLLKIMIASHLNKSLGLFFAVISLFPDGDKLSRYFYNYHFGFYCYGYY